MHYTTDKGDVGVAVISADLIKRGFDVLQPLSSSLPTGIGPSIPLSREIRLLTGICGS